MWHQSTPEGVVLFTKIFENTLRTLHGNSMRAFCRALKDATGKAPTSTALGKLLSPDEFQNSSATTYNQLHGILLIPMTEQFFALEELDAVIIGQIPTIRFVERDERPPFSKELYAEIIARDEDMSTAAVKMDLTADRLERLLALNGFGASGLEWLNIFNYYSRNPDEQKVLAKFSSVKPVGPQTARDHETNGKGHKAIPDAS